MQYVRFCSKLVAGSLALHAACLVASCPDDPAHLADPNLKAPHSMVSEHFRIVWGRGASKDFTAEQAKGTLRNFEACRDFYVGTLGLKPPGERDGKRYRITIATMEGGYHTGGGVVNIDPSGLRVDPPSWVIPHELMHAFQEVQGGHMIGDWWESHANYGTERMLMADPKRFAGESEFDPSFASMAHWYLAHGRDYYLCWPIWCYLDENPDKLPGLGQNLSTRMWQQAGQEEEFFHIVQRLAPAVNISDVIGLYARRCVAWDFRNGAAMRKKFDDYLVDETAQRSIYPELVPRADDPTWMRVPAEKAPQQAGWTVHRLEPIGRNVTVGFRGCADASRGADWRTCLVIRRADGAARYGTMWNAGEVSITLEPGETNLFLVVAATPTTLVFGNQDEMKYPWNTHPQRQRFPYEISLSGARVAATPRPSIGVDSHRHAHGGGLVENSATVSPTAFVGSTAMVLGEARVTGSARIEDFAVVRNAAEVRDRAVVSGHAQICGQAVVGDDARVRDWAVVTDEARVGGRARVLQRATVKERARVRDDATIEGCADVWGDAGQCVGGDAVLCADYGGGRTVTNGFQFGFVPYDACPQEWITARTAPARRYVSYDFDRPHESLAKDSPGITDGIVTGSPRWHEGDETRRGFLEFDGVSDSILLERSCCDFQAATFSAWIKWRGGNARQTLFHFGGGADTFVSIAIDEAGQLALRARKDDEEFSVTSHAAIPRQRWTHIAAAMDGENATLVVNGQPMIRGACGLRPEDCLAPADERSLDHHYFGRDREGNRFAGCADEIRIHSTVMRSAGLWQESSGNGGPGSPR